ncbi:MAG: BatD family protein [Gemmatimonadales bacterium]|jgi:hypothetical protein
MGRKVASLLACLIARLALAAAPPAAAQDVSVRAYLDRSEIGLDQLFVLNVEVRGTQQIDSEPQLPDVSSFATYLGRSTSTSMQMINGRTTVSLTLQFRYQANEEGTFEIGPVEVRADGETYRTEPLQLTITAKPPATQSRPESGAERDLEIEPKDLFVTAEVSKRSVYENEPVIVEYRIYTRVNVDSYSITRLPTTKGFWVEDLSESGSPTVDRVIRDGVQYATAPIRKVALFPTGPGARTVESLAVEAQVRVRRQPRDLFEDFFSESMFARRVPVGLASEPIEIEVLPLPEEGKPEDFSGFVGGLDVSASLDKTQTETNQAVTLRVTMKAEGNVRSLSEPVIDFPADFEVYPPDVSERIDREGNRIAGSKTFEYVLLPRSPGRKTIPAIEVSYFDTRRREYATATSEPLAIEVTGTAVEGPVVGGLRRGGIEPLRQDIRFIHIATPSFRPIEGSLFGRPDFWIVLLVPLIAVGGAVGFRRHRDRLEGDVAYARHRRAGRVAKKRLGRVRALKSPSTTREFYAEVARALEGFLADKLNLAEAGLIGEQARARLAAREVSDEAVGEYFACLSECDRQRFAPAESSLEEMDAFLKRTAEAMTRLNGELSR